MSVLVHIVTAVARTIYDESGLTDRFLNVVHVADQPGTVAPNLNWVLLLRDYYNTKKFVKDLGLPVEKIHACKNSCMLYWKDDVDFEYCKFRGDARATTDHMTWHATHQIKKGSMCHQSDTEVWKHFDRMYPDFTEESCNVRLGLCTDGFAPHVPGPSNLKRLIDVYLEPIIKELL
ncbi:hypothetical protein Sango_1248000 [Sesamum angolense]|uniref:Uncharacterized protein n=1 Tax=Sesamum angolense TaxID=2727404 RepID=A0AAE1WQM5_9LAMI|nr:hypothetical protein Sango_1248000 [Sesamum angolense]